MWTNFAILDRQWGCALCRGVTRLDGAWSKKQVCRPMFEPEVFWKQMYYFEKKCSWHCWNFLAPPQWFGARGIVPSCPPRYVSGVMQWKSENFPENNLFTINCLKKGDFNTTISVSNVLSCNICQGFQTFCFASLCLESFFYATPRLIA